MPEKLLTLKEASDALGIPEGQIKELVEKGDLPAYKIGGEFLRFRKEQVEAVRKVLREEVRQAPARGPVVKARAISYKESFQDKVADFFYFNDFYIISIAIIAFILWFIFKT